MRRPQALAPIDLAFLRGNARWLAAGFLLALGSSFGQTFFISIFADPIRAAFGLSHGAWGALYMLGTLASAATLIQLGRRADTADPRRLAAIIALALGAVCMAMAGAWSVWALPILIFGLRLCGQGLMSHLSQTLTARWFVATRGRALAIVSFGYPVGEAIMPLMAVALIQGLGWRASWLVAGLIMLLGLAPLLWVLLAKERTPAGTEAAEPPALGLGDRHWTRGQAVRSRAFWLIAPALLSPSFIVTVVFFFPALIASSKGWTLEAWAASYSIYALTSVVASFAGGYAIDRFDARAMLPFYQLPMAAALGALFLAEGVAGMAVTMALLGCTSGIVATTHSALLAELFGAKHLGAIKAMGHAVMVVGSALGPFVVGALLDLGLSFAAQSLGMIAFIMALSIGMLAAQPALRVSALT